MKFKTLATTVLATAAIFALGACGNSNGAKRIKRYCERSEGRYDNHFLACNEWGSRRSVNKINEDFMKKIQKLKWNYKINLLTLIYKPKSIRL